MSPGLEDIRAVSKYQMHAASSAAAGAPNDSSGECNGRRLPVVLIDFSQVSINRNFVEVSSLAYVVQISGTHVSPLLRWHRAWWGRLHHGFASWIDWDWRPWLEDHYRHTVADVIDETLNFWRPRYLFRDKKAANYHLIALYMGMLVYITQNCHIRFFSTAAPSLRALCPHDGKQSLVA